MLALQFATLLILSVILAFFDWDRRIAAYFFHTGEGWYLAKQPLWQWLYTYGTIPGILLTLAALVVWLAGFYVRSLKSWRRPCLVVVLTTILAAGLLVNSVLKQYWGRPRPSQTVEFGGQWEYRPIFPPGTPGKGASFPCGHCTMGFVFLALAGLRRRSKALAYGGVAVGIGLGGLLSAARVVQGAHFISDTLWSLGIVGMAATALVYYLPYPRPETTTRGGTARSRPRRIWITFAVMVAIMAVAVGFLTRRPYYNTMVYPLELNSLVESIHIQINSEPESAKIFYRKGEKGSLEVNAHGFGWVEFDYNLGYGVRMVENTLNITLHIEARSYFAELDHALTLILPERLKDQVTVLLNRQRVDKGSGREMSTALPSVLSLSKINS